MSVRNYTLNPEPENSKKLKFTDHYRQMWPFVKPYWVRALLAVLICIPVGALDSVIAFSLKPYMDHVLVDKDMASPIYIPLLIVAFTTVQGLLNYAAIYLNTWVGTRINHDLKRALFRKMMSFEPAFFDQNASGTIIQRFATDADIACLGLLDNLKLFVSRFFSSVSLIAVLIYNSWQLSIIAIVVLLCALLPLTQVRRRIKDLIKSTIARSSGILTHYNECHAGSKTIASYNLQEKMYLQCNEILCKLFKLTMKMVKKTGWMTPLMHVVVSVGVGAVIGFGSYLIVNGTITSGNFVSFITALIMLYTPIKGIGKNFNNVQISFLAIERITDVLNLTPDIADKFAVYTAGSIKTKGSFNAIILQVAVNCLRTADDVNANAVLLVVFSQQTGVGIGVVTADDYQRLDSKFFTVLLGRLEMFFGFQFSTSGTDHIKTTGIAISVNDLIRQKDLFPFNQTVRPLEEAVKFARRIQRFQPVIKPRNYVVTARSLTTGKNHPDCQRRQRSTLTGLEG